MIKKSKKVSVDNFSYGQQQRYGLKGYFFAKVN